MSEKIQKIRDLLNELEAETSDDNKNAFLRDFSALELPAILRDAVDFLFPQVEPYEASFYIYLLRNSMLAQGKQYIRVSTRGLMSGVVKSASGQSTSISLQKVREILQTLEKLGAIQKQGEPNKEGTLYKVFLPEEIDCCREAMKQAVNRETEGKNIDVEKEADFYNIKENRVRVYERDGYQCGYCKKLLTRFTATLDHIKPVCEGGDHSFDNLKTACLDCNSRKNKKMVGDFLVDR